MSKPGGEDHQQDTPLFTEVGIQTCVCVSPPLNPPPIDPPTHPLTHSGVLHGPAGVFLWWPELQGPVERGNCQDQGNVENGWSWEEEELLASSLWV